MTKNDATDRERRFSLALFITYIIKPFLFSLALMFRRMLRCLVKKREILSKKTDSGAR